MRDGPRFSVKDYADALSEKETKRLPHSREVVIAPCDADDTRAAYFAKTPVG